METTTVEIPPFSKAKERIRFGNERLRKIAVMNVKKSGGGPRSDHGNLALYANYDRLEIAEQIRIIDPTVVVCGYTCDYLASAIDPGLKEERNDNLYYFTSLNDHEVIVLDWWHPSNQYPDLLNYYGLIGAYQQALRASSL